MSQPNTPEQAVEPQQVTPEGASASDILAMMSNPQEAAAPADEQPEDHDVAQPTDHESGDQPTVEEQIEGGQPDDLGDPSEPAEPAAGEEGEPRRAKNFRGSWAHLEDRERRVIELTAKRGHTLEEALRIVYGSAPGDLAEIKQQVERLASGNHQQEEPKADPAAELEQQIDEQYQSIDSIQDRLEQSFDEEERKTIRQELRKAHRDAAELVAKRHVAEYESRRRQEQEQNQQRQTVEQQFQEAEDRVVALYPDLTNPETEFYKAVSDELTYLQETGSPLLNNPRHPLIVGNRIAMQLGIKQAESDPSTTRQDRPSVVTPQTPPATPSAHKGSQPVIRPVPAGGSPVEPPSVKEEIRRIVTTGTPDEMLDALKNYGTPLSELYGDR